MYTYMRGYTIYIYTCTMIFTLSIHLPILPRTNSAMTANTTVAKPTPALLKKINEKLSTISISNQTTEDLQQMSSLLVQLKNTPKLPQKDKQVAKLNLESINTEMLDRVLREKLNRQRLEKEKEIEKKARKEAAAEAEKDAERQRLKKELDAKRQRLKEELETAEKARKQAIDQLDQLKQNRDLELTKRAQKRARDRSTRLQQKIPALKPITISDQPFGRKEPEIIYDPLTQIEAKERETEILKATEKQSDVEIENKEKAQREAAEKAELSQRESAEIEILLRQAEKEELEKEEKRLEIQRTKLAEEEEIEKGKIKQIAKEIKQAEQEEKIKRQQAEKDIEKLKKDLEEQRQALATTPQEELAVAQEELARTKKQKDEKEQAEADRKAAANKEIQNKQKEINDLQLIIGGGYKVEEMQVRQANQDKIDYYLKRNPDSPMAFELRAFRLKQRNEENGYIRQNAHSANVHAQSIISGILAAREQEQHILEKEPNSSKAAIIEWLRSREQKPLPAQVLRFYPQQKVLPQWAKPFGKGQIFE